MTSLRHPIDTSRLLAGLEQPLQLISDPGTRERVQAYIDAAKPQVERAAFDVLSGAVQAINESSPNQLVSLVYADGALSVQVQDVQEEEPGASFSEASLERVTLRLPKELKEMIDVAAAHRGMSANSWYIRALSRAVARELRERTQEGDRGGHHGRRQRGFYRGRGRGPRDAEEGVD